ncbi:MAG: serine/threonine dehydratase [Paracoccaceae bacterium]|nr:serine/threonine dehydratase [Paracoccaceae bacterium]MDG1372694.1 serine/threonine dehydratase [Paracoccaceae bacterium]
MTITMQSIIEADRAIRPYVRRTPVMEVDPKDFGCDWGGRLTLKLEGFQHAGSFKPRGAFTTLLTGGRETRDLVAVSGGNHGAAVGYAARALGLKATIFVPTFAPTPKVEKIKSYGAEVRLIGDNIADTIAAYDAFRSETDVADVHPYEAIGTITGQGTLGLEWAEQCPDMDAVLIAIGGGGLISGMAYAMQMGPSVIGVEPKDARCAYEARKAGAPVEMTPTSIARDSLGAPSIGRMNHEAISSHVDDLALVEDDAIRAAQKALWSQCGIAAELGASTALAAVMSGAVTPEPGSHVGVLVCGSNVDLTTI